MAPRPKPWTSLEAAFYKAHDNGRAYEFLASGIQACLENATSLAEEFACLASHEFNARAQFVMATTMEEMGKALMLFDFVRIPWDRKQWITGLCKAFYHHLKKAAYAKVVCWPGSGAIADALQLFQIGLIEYWPSRDPESGEPDEYANGIVSREWGLYVDWNEFDGHWFRPVSSTLAYFYAQERAPSGERLGEEQIRGVLSQLTKASEEGLFTSAALEVVHKAMPSIYVTAATSEAEVIGVIEDTARRLSDIGIKLSDATVHANFMRYPLYAVLLTPEQIKSYWEP